MKNCCVIHVIILIFAIAITPSSAFIITKKSHLIPSSSLLLSSSSLSSSSSSGDDNNESKTYNKLSIKYCTGCRWMLRSSWMAQELLTTFQDEIDEVSLLPSRPPAPGGQFIITLNNKDVIWDREEKGTFPEIKELKRLVRDKIMPAKDLGHTDSHKKEEDKELIIQQEDEETEDYWVSSSSSKAEVSGIKVTSSTNNDESDDNDNDNEYLDTRKYFGVA